MGVSNAGDANGGTLVLDEIGSCPKKVQAGLLRVMNSGEYQTMGSTRTLHSDLCLIGATNEGDEGYRVDFLARVDRRIHLPALRDIPEDLGLLIRHFARGRAKRGGYGGDDLRPAVGVGGVLGPARLHPARTLHSA
jgi:transcriptional regulator with GAF, ATPase, and Fis domain